MTKDAVLKAVRQWEVIDLGYDGLWLSPVNKVGSFDKNECPITVTEASAFEKLLTANAGLVEALTHIADKEYQGCARSDAKTSIAREALAANERAMQEIVLGGVS